MNTPTTRRVSLARPLSADRVRAVPVPSTPLLARALSRVDWSDAYAVAVPSGSSADALEWAELIFHSPPAWIRRLFLARKALARMAGIERGALQVFETVSWRRGEVLLGTDQEHMAFRASVLLEADRVVVSTVVQVHNHRGRIYSALIRWVHPLVVRGTLTQARRRAATNRPRSVAGDPLASAIHTTTRGEDMTTTPINTAQRIELAGMTGDSYGTDDHRPPLVLLHGQSFDRRLWHTVLSDLFDIDPGRRVVNLDLPGYGESPAQMPHTNRHLLELLRQAVDQAGITAPVIVGHSSSGGLALMYAATHPSSGAVDIDAVPTDLEPLARNLQSLEPQIAGDALQQVWAGVVESFELDLLDPDARAAVLDNMELRPDILRSYWHELIYGNPSELSRLLEGVAHGIAAADVQVLLVAGREPGPGMSDLVGAAGANLTVEAWPRSGHFPHLAHPARFARRLAATGAWPAGAR